MLGLKRVHHIAIIATDYAKSKAFYCDILGFTLQSEFYRAERDSWKGDLALNGEYVIELFSFPFLLRAQAVRKPVVCATWRLASTILMPRLRICRRMASPVKLSASIRLPISVSPSSTIPTACRWRFTNSNTCQNQPWRVTCRAISS